MSWEVPGDLWALSGSGGPLTLPRPRGKLTRLDGLEGGPRGLFWGELSKSTPRFSFSTDMSLQQREEGASKT